MAILFAVLMVMGKTKGMQVVPIRAHMHMHRDSENGNTTFQSSLGTKASKDYANAIQIHRSIFRRPPEHVYHTENIASQIGHVERVQHVQYIPHANIVDPVVPSLSLLHRNDPLMVHRTTTDNDANPDLTINVNAAVDEDSVSPDSGNVITLLPSVVTDKGPTNVVTSTSASTRKMQKRNSFASRKVLVVASSDASSPLTPLSDDTSTPLAPRQNLFVVNRPVSPAAPFRREMSNIDSGSDILEQVGNTPDYGLLISPRSVKTRNPRPSISVNKKPPPLPLFTTLSNGSLAVLVSPRTGTASYISHTGMGSRSMRQRDVDVDIGINIPHTVNDPIAMTNHHTRDVYDSNGHILLKRHTSLPEDEHERKDEGEEQDQDEYGLHKNISDLDMDVQYGLVANANANDAEGAKTVY